MRYRLFTLFLFVSSCLFVICAEEPATVRPVYSAYMFEAGSTHLAETYLSPLHYDGWTIGIAHRRAQAMRFNPERWHMELGARFTLDRTLARPARNVVEWRAELELDWSMMHKWRLDKGFTVFCGGFTRADVGVFYLARNGNNPVAAKASWTVGPKVGLAYDVRLGRVPFAVRYFAEMPLTGVFFSPAYGELYYEIYLGNYRGLVRGAWPGNYFRLDNSLTADFRFGATILRVGYAPRFFSSKTSDIVTRVVSHNFIFGIAQEWTALGIRKPDTAVQKYISAY